MLLKIIPAAPETAQDIPPWHIVPALFNPRGDAPEPELWR